MGGLMRICIQNMYNNDTAAHTHTHTRTRTHTHTHTHTLTHTHTHTDITEFVDFDATYEVDGLMRIRNYRNCHTHAYAINARGIFMCQCVWRGGGGTHMQME